MWKRIRVSEKLKCRNMTGARVVYSFFMTLQFAFIYTYVATHNRKIHRRHRRFAVSALFFSLLHFAFAFFLSPNWRAYQVQISHEFISRTHSYSTDRIGEQMQTCMQSLYYRWMVVVLVHRAKKAQNIFSCDVNYIFCTCPSEKANSVEIFKKKQKKRKNVQKIIVIIKVGTPSDGRSPPHACLCG